MNNLKEIKKYITTMKLHIDQIDRWMTQANQMVYELEDKVMDMEDQKCDSLDLENQFIALMNLGDAQDRLNMCKHNLDFNMIGK